MYVVRQADDSADRTVVVQVATCAIISRTVSADGLVVSLRVAVYDGPSGSWSEVGNGSSGTSLARRSAICIAGGYKSATYDPQTPPRSVAHRGTGIVQVVGASTVVARCVPVVGSRGDNSRENETEGKELAGGHPGRFVRY